MPIHKLQVESLAEPVRLDLYLSHTDLGLSRSQIRKLFGEGRVVVDGRKIRPSFKISGGEQIEVEPVESKSPGFSPEAISLDIVYEDEHLVVINKPAGLVVHPAPGNETGTLANALLHHFRELADGYEGGYPGLVHRLDKNTSGLMLVAKSDEIHRQLALQLQDRTLNREYRAVIWGTLNPPTGQISIPLGRSRSDRRVMSSSGGKTKQAISDYETIETHAFLSYIKLKLQTGRTHQIRAHLKESGRPVFGDPEYSGRSSQMRGIEARHRQFARELLGQIERQMLHAARLRFRHPASGQSREFVKEPPKDFGQILELIRQYR